MTTTVVGMGKIGLPLAVQFAQSGEIVIGTDLNCETVAKINQGIVPFHGEAHLEEYLLQVVAMGMLSAQLETANAVSRSDTVVVLVPLKLDGSNSPDFDTIDVATMEVSKGLKKGTLVIFETTVPVGTTSERFARILEDGSGLKAGLDFNLAFSPERVLSGRIFEDLQKYPKIVGGKTPKCAERASKFYQRTLTFKDRPDLPKANGVWNVGNCESAEFVKLAETTYRDVNIGLANQFAKYADLIEANVYQVIEAANSQPYSHIHSPGISVGGHCIPVYPQLYLFGDPSASIVSAAREENSTMPEYAINILILKIGRLESKNVLIFGLSYREGVKEDSYSGTYTLSKIIEELAGHAYVYDPLYTDKEIREKGLRPFDKSLRWDALIIHTTHPKLKEFLTTVEQELIIIDGRNVSLNENDLGLNLNNRYVIGNQTALNIDSPL